jgi:hypothetical protein
VEEYETLRKAVIEGFPQPVGLAILRFHGLLHGLLLLITKEAPSRISGPHRDPADAPRPDNEFVRILTNLVLSTHSEESGPTATFSPYPSFKTSNTLYMGIPSRTIDAPSCLNDVCRERVSIIQIYASGATGDF